MYTRSMGANIVWVRLSNGMFISIDEVSRTGATQNDSSDESSEVKHGEQKYRDYQDGTVK
jgi:hypothetical protein